MSKVLVSVIMGSTSDWEVMRLCCEVLQALDIPFEKTALSAHRTPDQVADFAKTAQERGVEVIIAAAGGAAHLPGVIAAHTLVPVIGVPMQTAAFGGLDSLLSIVQMPREVPVATVAVGKAGAVNAAILAAQILGLKYPEFRQKLAARRLDVRTKVLEAADLEGLN